jgi:hypothetical protein
MISFIYQSRFPQTSFSLGAFLAQKMLTVGLGSFDLPTTGGSEPLGSSSIGSYFWQLNLLQSFFSI